MVLLTVIDNEYGTEIPYDDIKCVMLESGWMIDTCPNVRQVNRYKFSSYDEMKHALDNLPDLQEGFVAQDSNGLRVKFKNDLYLKLHKMRGDLGFTEKKIASIVADKEEEEVLTYFGQYRNLFEPIIEAREKLFTDIMVSWDKFSIIDNQKDFALNVKDLTYSAILFTMRKDKAFHDVWNNMRTETKTELILNYKEFGDGKGK